MTQNQINFQIQVASHEKIKIKKNPNRKIHKPRSFSVPNQLKIISYKQNKMNIVI